MILYVRHAESTWNAAGRWQGQADPPLSTRGREQAARLAERLAAHAAVRELALLATSPLARARETAERLASRLGLALRPLDALRELDAGAWSGLTRAEVERRDPQTLARFLGGDDAVAAGGGESRAALRERVCACLTQLAAEAAGRPFLVIGHLGALRSLCPDARLENAGFLELPLSVLEPAAAAASLAARSAAL